MRSGLLLPGELSNCWIFSGVLNHDFTPIVVVVEISGKCLQSRTNTDTPENLASALNHERIDILLFNLAVF